MRECKEIYSALHAQLLLYERAVLNFRVHYINLVLKKLSAVEGSC